MKREAENQESGFGTEFRKRMSEDWVKILVLFSRLPVILEIGKPQFLEKYGYYGNKAPLQFSKKVSCCAFACLKHKRQQRSKRFIGI